MTKSKDIRSVAIIGAGAAGLTSLFELLNTKKDGSTTLKYKADGSFDFASANDDPAFTKIVVFEQSSKVGGVWNPSFEKPDVIPQELFDTEHYDDANILRPKTKVPKEFNNQSFDNPLVLTDDEPNPPIKWNSSGIYKNLYSNVSKRYLRNSFIPLNETSKARAIDPFLTNSEITGSLDQFVQTNSLKNYVRVNSEIVDASKSKTSDQWVVTVKEVSDNGKFKWYSEYFDGVIVSTGHYSIPHIPIIQGLSDWNKNLPGSIIHSKSFRSEQIFKDKKVLFIGTGLSGIDILQYAFPVASEVIVSRTPDKDEIYGWLKGAATSEGILIKPRIRSVSFKDNKSVLFDDGTKVSDIDYLIFSTGYHWHYPFLNPEETGVTVKPLDQSSIPNHNSLVDGLYLSTIAIEDPSIAFIGVLLTPFKWPSFELEASIVSGVWSGKAKLPPKTEILAVNEERLRKKGANLLFHYYPYREFPSFVKQATPFLPSGRHSDNIFDAAYITEQEDSENVAESLFYQLKSKKIDIQDTT